MLQRLDFYNIQEKLETYGISIWEIVKESDRAIDFLNSAELSDDFVLISEWLVKAEDLIKSVFNRMLAKINPYTNELIEWDNKKQRTYANFKLEMGNFMRDVDDRRATITDKISLKDMEDPSSNLSTKMKFNSHLLFLNSFLREFVLKVLENACERFISVQKPCFKVIEEEGDLKKEISYDVKNIVSNPKDERFFWYYVYFYVAEMSSVNVTLFRIKEPVHFKPYEMADVIRQTGASIGYNPQSSPSGSSKTHLGESNSGDGGSGEEFSEETRDGENPEEDENLEEVEGE